MGLSRCPIVHSAAVCRGGGRDSAGFTGSGKERGVVESKGGRESERGGYKKGSNENNKRAMMTDRAQLRKSQRGEMCTNKTCRRDLVDRRQHVTPAAGRGGERPSSVCPVWRTPSVYVRLRITDRLLHVANLTVRFCSELFIQIPNRSTCTCLCICPLLTPRLPPLTSLSSM